LKGIYVAIGVKNFAVHITNLGRVSGYWILVCCHSVKKAKWMPVRFALILALACKMEIALLYFGITNGVARTKKYARYFLQAQKCSSASLLSRKQISILFITTLTMNHLIYPRNSTHWRGF